MVAMAVDAGWREDGGEAVEELQGREPEGGTAGEVGPREEVEDLVGAAADEVESVQGEGTPGTIPDEAFEAGAVGGLDADAGIEAEPRRPSPLEDPFGVRRAHEPKASNPPPCSQESISSASWGSRRPRRRQCRNTLFRTVCCRSSRSWGERAVGLGRLPCSA